MGIEIVEEGAMVQRRAVLFWLALTLTGNSSTIFACVCDRMPTVLEEFDRADLVVIAKAVSIWKPFIGMQSAIMVVEKVYKGNIGVGDELEFNQTAPSDCTYRFFEKDIGNQYLFYLRKPTKENPLYNAGVCGRHKDIREAVDDLLYLDNLDRVSGKNRISGTLRVGTGESVSLAGRKIKILQNDKVWEIATNKEGVYEIYDLPAGEYLIEPEIPEGWKISTYNIHKYGVSFSGDGDEDINVRTGKIPIILEKGKHAGLDIIFEH